MYTEIKAFSDLVLHAPIPIGLQDQERTGEESTPIIPLYVYTRISSSLVFRKLFRITTIGSLSTTQDGVEGKSYIVYISMIYDFLCSTPLTNTHQNLNFHKKYLLFCSNIRFPIIWVFSLTFSFYLNCFVFSDFFLTLAIFFSSLSPSPF